MQKSNRYITTTGLTDLLVRHGVEPTGNSKKDVSLAILFMPPRLPKSMQIKKAKHKSNPLKYIKRYGIKQADIDNLKEAKSLISDEIKRRS